MQHPGSSSAGCTVWTYEKRVCFGWTDWLYFQFLKMKVQVAKLMILVHVLTRRNDRVYSRYESTTVPSHLITVVCVSDSIQR